MTAEAIMIRSPLLLLVAVLYACAQASPPPGGPQDRDPPRLLSTKPEQLAVVPQWKDEVLFSFDEKISERLPRDAVMISPETGRPSLERDGSNLKVRIEGGWKTNTIYRVVIVPGVRDRMGNTRREPTELIFSTGPQLVPTAIAGIVSDRITGQPLADMRVVALSYPDSTPHATVTDTSGFFGLRYLPPGRYTVRAFEDRNRNRQLDFAEKSSERSIVLSTVRDTMPEVFLALLASDTTPARLTRAEAHDSLQIRLVFDDHLDPEGQLTGVAISLFQLPDSTPVSGAQLMQVHAFEKLRRAQTKDSATTRPGRPDQPADTTVRPTQELVVVPSSALNPGTRYQVVVAGITNLAGAPRGGGSATFETRKPVQRDTIAVRRDTMDVRRDTIPMPAPRR